MEINFVNLLYNDMPLYNDINRMTLEDDLKNLNSNDRIKRFVNLELINCTFGYEPNNTVVEDMSVEINAGEFIGIYGESGSGKSTIINILLGLIKPNRGKINLNKNDITGKSKMLTRLGYLPQEVFLIDDSIKNNICLGQKDNEIDEEKLKNVFQ